MVKKEKILGKKLYPACLEPIQKQKSIKSIKKLDIFHIKYCFRYILTESVTDKRIKISSLSNRLYLKAPNVNEIRNQGNHQTMLATLDKKNVLGFFIF